MSVMRRLRKLRVNVDRDRLLSLVIDYFPGFVFLIDDKGYVLMNEGAAQRTAGWEPGSLVGTHVSEIHSHTREANDTLRKAFTTKRPTTMESTFVGPNGKEVHANTRFIPINDGDRVLVFGLTLDVTETVEARRAREEAHTALVNALTEQLDSTRTRLRQSAAVQSQLSNVDDLLAG